MRKLTILLSAAVSLLLVSCSTQPKAVDFKMEKGVNIGIWLSQSRFMDERRDGIFTEEDIKLLADNGFDHIRLPVDEVQLFNQDMTVNESTVALIDRTITTCMKYDMRVIFDLHIIRAHNFLNNDSLLWRSEEEQDKFVDMWRVIQSILCKYPVKSVAYEILNEAVAHSDEQWSGLMLRVVDMIRETEKDRVIVLGANYQNNVAHVKNIQVPEGDKNIILSFHFYEPLMITHYQAMWTPLRILKFDGSRMQYPGQLIPDDVYAELNDAEKAVVEEYNKSYDKAWIQQTWQEAIDYAASKGLRLYLGEFGCLVNCGDAVRYAWLKDVVDVARENGIAYSLWEYSAEFGFASREEKGVIRDRELMEILVK